MFKRLRNRIMLMNLGFITVLMLVAFISIYWMTWQQVWSGIDMDLNKAVEFHPPQTSSQTETNDGEEMLPDPEMRTTTPPTGKRDAIPNIQDNFSDRSISFSIIVNSDDSIVSINSFYYDDDQFYQDALNAASDSDKMKDVCVLDESRWAFMVKEYGEIRIIGFVHIDNRLAILDRLLLTFFIVAVGALILIFIISYILTKRSLRPTEEAFARQKAFISHASHELRTPIAVIGANTDLLLDDEEKEGFSDDGKRRLAYIRDEVKRMTGLTTDLLYLANLEEGSNAKHNNAAALFNLSDALESHLLGIEGLAYERGRRLAYDIAPEISMFGIREQILQVLSILMDNALTYSTPDSEIALSLTKNNNRIRIDVSNSGEGLSAEDSEHIFDRFYRADSARDRSKSHYGLGLSIASTIITQHNGTIDCTSEHIPDGLTTFTIRLPLDRRS